MNLAAWGALLASFATALGVVAALWGRRIEARSKKHDDAIGTIALGQTVLTDGIRWSEQHNKELRVDLLAAEQKIDQLEAELVTVRAEAAELRRRDDACQETLRNLMREIEMLKGQAGGG